jgi:hypothetical protein
MATVGFLDHRGDMNATKRRQHIATADAASEVVVVR